MHKGDQSSSMTKAGESPGCLSKLFSFLTWPVRKIWEILCGLCCYSKKQEEQKESPIKKQEESPIDYKKPFLTDPKKVSAALLELKSVEEFILKFYTIVAGLEDKKSTLTQIEAENMQKVFEKDLIEKITKKVEGPAADSAALASATKRLYKELGRMWECANLILQENPQTGDRDAKIKASMDKIKDSLKDGVEYSYILTYFASPCE